MQANPTHVQQPLPDATYLETVLSSVDHHAFGSLMVLLFAAVVVAGLFARKK